jgi:ATP-dependent helicase/nuclease subunit A
MHAVDRDQLDPSAREAADALALLAQLHVGRNHRPIAQTITMLPEAVRAHAGIALWPTGEQALANCLRLVDLARRFEPSATSFRAFVERIESDAERGEAGEAPIEQTRCHSTKPTLSNCSRRSWTSFDAFGSA